MVRFSYSQAVQTLYSLKRFGVKLGLSNIRAFLDRLGNPQESFLSCHIAGTNGKGTCAAVCEAMLRAHGATSGLYTSPHLASMGERVKVCGQPVPEEFIASWVSRHYSYINGQRITFFEAVTALAFDYFHERGVEVAAVEVGLGGRLDATNVIDSKLSVITSISLEHTKYLGASLQQIAREKAAIAKPGVPLLCGERRSRVLEVIASVCSQARSPLLLFDDAVRIRRTGLEQEGLIFSYRGPGLELDRARVALYGSHQLRNVGLGVWAAGFMLAGSGLKMDQSATRSALESLDWPGRFQRLRLEKGTELVLDVAHNPSAAARLVHVFRRLYGAGKAVAVVALAGDKDFARFLGHLLKIADLFIFPVVDFSLGDRRVSGVSPRKLRKYLREISKGTEVLDAAGMKEALELAQKLSGGRPVLVTGSFRTVGEAMRVLGIKT
ncbi:MAG TPA: folylpolyglutamate synthase/dihydrofolate synthase family protein [archaeon]|nr:folylpolyglutamate synthase/dihydrofolate synthase family protein [archaeon]